MALTNGFQLPFGIQPVNPLPVDSWSGPYTGGTIAEALTAANTSIPSAIRFQSMEVRIIVGGESYKYWYRDGITDSNLVEFASTSSGISGPYVSKINGFTGGITFAGGTGIGLTYLNNIFTYSNTGVLSVTGTGGLTASPTTGVGNVSVSLEPGYKLLRSYPDVTALNNSPNPQDGDLAWVVNDGNGFGGYYYYTTALSPNAWVKMSLLSNAFLGDVNLDGTVDGVDLAVILNSWGILGTNPSLNFGVSDGIAGAFKVYAYGATLGKKADILRIATDSALSTVSINSETLTIDAYTSIYGDGTTSLELINGGLKFSDGTTQGTAPQLKTINGCTGNIGITGTPNEVEITTSCPSIQIGLPNDVVISGSLRVNGSIYIDGGTF
jgi:hypothetical protein